MMSKRSKWKAITVYEVLLKESEVDIKQSAESRTIILMWSFLTPQMNLNEENFIFQAAWIEVMIQVIFFPLLI